MADALTAEFDTLAGWTAEAVQALGPDYAVPAGCRGSGSPSALAWLAESMGVRPGQRVLDAGSGVGGPAAWLRDHYGAEILPVEPMLSASRAAKTLFGFEGVTAWSQALPLRDACVDACWCLGVLDTTPDEATKRQLLTELRRVLPSGRPLGLLVIVADGTQALDRPPEGNDFPTREALHALLSATNFALVQELRTDSLAASPVDWQAKADRVDAELERRYADHPVFAQAEENGAKIGRLLDSGALSSWLLHAVAV